LFVQFVIRGRQTGMFRYILLRVYRIWVGTFYYAVYVFLRVARKSSDNNRFTYNSLKTIYVILVYGNIFFKLTGNYWYTLLCFCNSRYLFIPTIIKKMYVLNLWHYYTFIHWPLLTLEKKKFFTQSEYQYFPQCS